VVVETMDWEMRGNERFRVKLKQMNSVT
jgi:hypothetical protein